ncbi:MAG: DnaJ domain-containing protein [Bernardetiaceae bacterium]|nr:DnaJ domain-containing protein [Bernardetiaceae bacterium]
MANYYAILGLPAFADRDQVKSAFKQLALLYHPDRNPGNQEAEEKFKLINEAYQTLNNPNRKWQYDEHLRLGLELPAPGQRRAPAARADPRYRRRSPVPPQARPTAKKRPYLPDGQTTLLAFGVVVVMFVLIRGGFMAYGNWMYNRALTALEQKQYAQAFELLNKATGVDPYNTTALTLKGDVSLEHMRYFGEAADAYSEAMRYSSEPLHQLHFKRGLAYSQMHGMQTEAQMDLRLAAYHFPNEAAMLAQIAEAFELRLKQPAEAFGFYQKALKLNQKDFRLYQQAGELGEKLEKYPEAIEYFTRSLALNNRNAQAYLGRAKCHYGLNQRAQTCADLAAAQQLDRYTSHFELEYYCQFDPENEPTGPAGQTL